MLASLAVICACATPRQLWSARDAERQLTARVFSDGEQQWVEGGARFDVVGELVVTHEAFAYAARRGDQWFVTASGARSYGPFDAVAELKLSEAHVAFAAQSAQGWRVVVDGAASRAYEWIQTGTLHFSGEHFAYVGSDGRCARIVVDGVEGVCRDRVLAVHVDSAGRSAAIVREGRRERFVFQGDEPLADAVSEWQLSPDGQHFAYAARHGERWNAVVDGRAYAECASVRHLRLGDHGRRTAWVCGEGRGASVVLDGETGPRFPAITAPLLAWDSPAFAYVAHDTQGAWVVAEDTMWGPYSEVSDLQLVASAGVAFVARAHGVTKVVHQEHVIELPAVVDGSLTVSDDGEHWAVVSADPPTRTFWLTVDGKRTRQLAAADVFDDTAPLRPWLANLLRRGKP